MNEHDPNKSGGLTEKIFLQNAPYNNEYQGPSKRLLFVCSAGLLRSPTGAALYSGKGYNTRSCGSDRKYALINLSANLILWADCIIFVNSENYRQAIQTFEPVYYDFEIKKKAIILDIEDDYEYNNPWLIKLFERQLDPKLETLFKKD
jgi:predicted protein tyrosine phosphatase